MSNFILAPVLGFEPRLVVLETIVLTVNTTPILLDYISSVDYTHIYISMC